MFQIIGIVLLFVCVFGVYVISGGKLDVVMHAAPHELGTILGAGVAALLIGNSLDVIKGVGGGMAKVFSGPKWKASDYKDLLSLLFLLTKAKLIFGAMKIGPLLATAQTFRGTILGTVTDQSGASVPGAKVTVRNVDTGQVRDTETAEDGSYAVPEIPIGTYTVTIEKAGFQSSVTTGVRVEVAVRVGVAVREAVGVREGVSVGRAVGASPCRRNSPTTFHSRPTKICT